MELDVFFVHPKGALRPVVMRMNGRMIRARMRMKGEELKMVKVYAPHGSTLEQKEKIEEDLKREIN